jgi:hypothetical protein
MIAPPSRQAGPARWAWGMCAVSFGLAVAAMVLGWILCVDGVLLGVFNVAQQYAPIALA